MHFNQWSPPRVVVLCPLSYAEVFFSYNVILLMLLLGVLDFKVVDHQIYHYIGEKV